jgi:aminoglycoside 3'-phosphotransferase II
VNLPLSIAELLLPHSLEQVHIGKSQSGVYQVRLKNQAPAFLKVGSSPNVVKEIRREIKVLHWLKNRLPVPRPMWVAEESETIHFLLSAVPGENLAAAAKGMPAEECLAAGTRFLRKWHSLPIPDCPFDRRLSVTVTSARQNLEAGLVDNADFDSERTGKTANDIHAELLGEIPSTEDLVFTHGDFCLPNLIFNTGEIAGAVDLARAGIADRHQDIALFLRSFQFNVAKPNIDLFLREYKHIKELDSKKLAFYRLLDEFF